LKIAPEKPDLVKTILDGVKRIVEQQKPSLAPVPSPAQSQVTPIRPERSFVYIAPGLATFLIQPGYKTAAITWSLVVLPRGPDPTYNINILLDDEIRHKQTTLNYPEIDAKNRAIEFRQPVIPPIPIDDPNHERYHAVMIFRDGRIAERLSIDRLTDHGRTNAHIDWHEWVWSMNLQDMETGEVIIDCKNKEVNLGVLTGSAQDCFPPTK